MVTFLQEALYHADLSTVFDGLNVLGRVPWTINKFVLDAAQRCWRDNIPLGDIPSRTDHCVPPKPIKPERNVDHLDPDSETVKAANAEFRAFKEALTRHHRIHQRNMVRLSSSCAICFHKSSHPSHRIAILSGPSIASQFGNVET